MHGAAAPVTQCCAPDAESSATHEAVVCELAKILDEEVPQILLFTAIDADAYSTRLKGVQATINDIMTWNVADWKVVE